MKIIFQSSNPNTFRATLVGYLWEIAQRHQVVLLAESIDPRTKEMLESKNLFPGLEKIIYYEAPFHENIFRKNWQLCKLSKRVIREFKPDIVVAPEDIWPMSLYLLRFAKRTGIITLALQDGFRMARGRELYLRSCRMNAYNKIPGFLPHWARLFLVKMKKYLGHFLYYWILPPSAGQMPFPGKTSFVFWDTSAGLRDADYSAVFSKRDYNLSVKDGVLPEKLFTIGHSLEHEATKKFFEKIYEYEKAEKPSGNVATIVWPEEKMGIRQGDYSLITKQELEAIQVRVVSLVSKKLADWKIFIKFRPDVEEEHLQRAKQLFEKTLPNVFVTKEPADKYIAMSNLIIGMSLPSTVLFTASKQAPEMPTLHLNLNKEFLADTYKDFESIEYIDTEEKFINVLDAIKNGKYQQWKPVKQSFDFADAAELVDHIYAKRLS